MSDKFEAGENLIGGRGSIRDMIDKVNKDAKGASVGLMNDGMVMRNKFGRSVIKQLEETDGDSVCATLGDDNYKFSGIEKNCKTIVETLRRKMYFDWKIRSGLRKSVESNNYDSLNSSANFAKTDNHQTSLDYSNESGKLDSINNEGDTNKYKDISNVDVKGKNRVHFGNDDDTVRDVNVFENINEMSTKIQNIYKDIFGELGEQDTVKHFVQLRHKASFGKSVQTVRPDIVTVRYSN